MNPSTKRRALYEISVSRLSDEHVGLVEHEPSLEFTEKAIALRVFLQKAEYFQEDPAILVTLNQYGGVGSGDGDHAANARLIAAAPEMYQALHEIYQCLIQQYVPETELPTLRALAKRALAKATKSPKEF